MSVGWEAAFSGVSSVTGDAIYLLQLYSEDLKSRENTSPSTGFGSPLSGHKCVSFVLCCQCMMRAVILYGPIRELCLVVTRSRQIIELFQPADGEKEDSPIGRYLHSTCHIYPHAVKHPHGNATTACSAAILTETCPPLTYYTGYSSDQVR